MSRAIPKVRQWRVRYYQGATMTHETIVSTINKRFAAWEARDVLGHMALWNATRFTVSLVKPETPHARALRRAMRHVAHPRANHMGPMDHARDIRAMRNASKKES